MSAIQAIVLDLDGTLLNRDKSISPRNYRAVRRCFDSGIPIIVATARPPRAAKPFVKDIPFVDYTVCYNGALVTCKSKRTQHHISIPIAVSEQINAFIRWKEPQAIVTYEVNDSWYTCTPVPDAAYVQLGVRPNDPKPQVVDDDYICSISPTKILVVGYTASGELVEKFGDQVNVIATDGGELVQIMHKDASKEAAVKLVLDELDIDVEHVMVFGDDYNDLGLFHMCGFPIAMGNGITELKNAAKYITETNDNDGVALALERFVG